MRNTPPQPQIKQLTDADLLNEFSLRLRDVGVFEYELPEGDRLTNVIRAVCAIHTELVHRKIDIATRIQRLTSETSWKMGDLLKDCLSYPNTHPYVKEMDGIRRRLRCRMCQKNERVPDAQLFWFCESCMTCVASALKHGVPCDGVVVFRTYTPSSRCVHANDDTVLVAETNFEEIYGVCELCVSAEIERRRATKS